MGKMAVEINGEVIEAESDQEEEELESETEVKDAELGESGSDETDEDKGDKSEDTDEDEVIVTIGEEAPPPDEVEQAPEWVKELRKTHRETSRENRELKQKLKELEEGGTKKPQPLGQKPKLENFDYDTDKFEKELEQWYERKRQIEQEQQQVQAEQKKQEESWKKQLSQYGEQKSQLKVKDFDDAEAMVIENLNATQQGVIVQGAENAALVMYALGKNPKKAQELASIKDPVKFAFAVAKLEAQLKVTSRKAPPPPEKRVANGTGSKSGAVDSTLERLRSEAAKTGDYTKVTQYKKQKRQQAK